MQKLTINGQGIGQGIDQAEQRKDVEMPEPNPKAALLGRTARKAREGLSIGEQCLLETKKQPELNPSAAQMSELNSKALRSAEEGHDRADQCRSKCRQTEPNNQMMIPTFGSIDKRSQAEQHRGGIRDRAEQMGDEGGERVAEVPSSDLDKTSCQTEV